MSAYRYFSDHPDIVEYPQEQRPEMMITQTIPLPGTEPYYHENDNYKPSSKRRKLEFNSDISWNRRKRKAGIDEDKDAQEADTMMEQPSNKRPHISRKRSQTAAGDDDIMEGQPPTKRPHTSRKRGPTYVEDEDQPPTKRSYPRIPRPPTF
ncbi:hypothetical protein Gasu2_33880 [Galdieria sulphuraria]|nr:hypothetical protein Gasu2_33880 [Galdieria sulphuraria]